MNGDGIEFISEVRNIQNTLPFRPYIIVTSELLDSHPVKSCLDDGLCDYRFSKRESDYSAEKIFKHINRVLKYIDCDTDIEEKVLISNDTNTETISDKNARYRRRLLAEFDNYYMTTRTDGKTFLIEAIIMALNSPIGQKIYYSKEIFPEIGQKYHRTWYSINRAIRFTITSAFTKTDLDQIQKLYPPYTDPKKGVPTNIEFIEYYVAKLRDKL